MARFASVLSLAIIGVIIADIVTHGTQTQAAANGVRAIETPWTSALLGTPVSS